MMELAVFLKHLATTHNLAVLLTNHMAAGETRAPEANVSTFHLENVGKFKVALRKRKC